METIVEDQETNYELDKVKKKYANLGDSVIMVQLERGNQGLGLSLAGHRDRNCMAVFVCGLNPKGEAYKSGCIEVGDEILEVNGVVLHGRCHLNASAIIKGLSGPIFKIIVLRRRAAVEDIAVRPLTHFPIGVEEEMSLADYQKRFPYARSVPISKGTKQLGIKIVEGKHAEIGPGIFVAELQSDGPAAQAGLKVGDMLLAVNKDTLLGVHYDTATLMLKQVEGLVTLIITPPESAKSNVAAGSSVAGSGDKSDSSANSKGLASTGQQPEVTPPVVEAPLDPTTCPIMPGRETTIEIASNNELLGLYLVGGQDTTVKGIIVGDVYKTGAASADGRLQAGDQITEVNGVSVRDAIHDTAKRHITQKHPKNRLVVHRPESIEYETLDVELMKKTKGYGLNFHMRSDGKCLYVFEVFSGTPASKNGQVAVGDMLVSVNDVSFENVPEEDALVRLRLLSGRSKFKLRRYKAHQQ